MTLNGHFVLSSVFARHVVTLEASMFLLWDKTAFKIQELRIYYQRQKCSPETLSFWRLQGLCGYSLGLTGEKISDRSTVLHDQLSVLPIHKHSLDGVAGVSDFCNNNSVRYLELLVKDCGYGYINRVTTKLEVHGRARREAARRRNSEWKVNLGIRNSSRNNATCRMTPKTVP